MEEFKEGDIVIYKPDYECNEMELEEAIRILTDDNKTYQLNKLLNDTLNIESPKYYQAIETVLQSLEKLQNHCKEMIKEKQELTSALLDSIPKKKIEEVIKEVDKKFVERTYYNGWGIIKDFKELLEENNVNSKNE